LKKLITAQGSVQKNGEVEEKRRKKRNGAVIPIAKERSLSAIRIWTFSKYINAILFSTMV
jgi:hypothetical protein